MLIYASRAEIVRFNSIRRALDHGTLSLDAPFDGNRYAELSLSPQDFQARQARTDREIRQYIIHKAYWLAYRFPIHAQTEGILYPIPFDEPGDLDYLGVTATEVWRNIRRMEGQGLLEKVLEGHARPSELLLSGYEPGELSSRGLPTATSLSTTVADDVLIGMLDPDNRISGRGQRTLRKAGIATELFPHDLMAEIEELNRDFIRDRESPESNSNRTLEDANELAASATASPPLNVRVALKRGHVSNFLIEYINDENEPIFIREARLFGGKDGKIELTEPMKPDDPSTWRVAPHCSATFGKTIVSQKDPAASLVKMNSNAGIFFETEMVVVASCEIRGHLSEARQTLYVKVNATKREIVPLV